MKKLLFGCCFAGLMFSCGEGKKSALPLPAQNEQTDSMEMSLDSVSDSTFLTKEVIPVSADESFADFFYNFASNERFQRSRVVFPFPFYKGKEVTRVEREAWKFDPMFSHEPAYTILFENEEDMEVEKDTSLNSVQTDWLYLDKREVKRYYFERKNNRWLLEAVNHTHIPHNEEGKEEDFFSFYARFSRDSVFQRQRLHQPLTFITSDPEDEFQILETTLDDGQWFAFRPPMVPGVLTNVHYGQPETENPRHKIIEYKGFGNGFSNVLYFERHKGIWKLTKFEDLSD